MTTKHNHNDGKALPFGRLKPVGECPRCDELRNGAEPVRLDGYDAKRRRDQNDANDDRLMRQNRAKGLCACGKPQGHDSGTCTAFQW